MDRIRERMPACTVQEPAGRAAGSAEQIYEREVGHRRGRLVMRTETPSASTVLVRLAMQANRSRNTRPEVKLRSLLFRHGLRFRVNRRIDLGSVKVRPDMVFVMRRVCVFVDGCWWHRCP